MNIPTHRRFLCIIVGLVVGISVVGIIGSDHGGSERQHVPTKHQATTSSAAPRHDPRNLRLAQHKTAHQADPTQGEHHHAAGCSSCGSCSRDPDSKNKRHKFAKNGVRQRLADNPRVESLLRTFVSGDRMIRKPALTSLKSVPVGKPVMFEAGNIDWKGIIDFRLEGEVVKHYGVTLDNGLGRLQVSLREDDRLQASILFKGENTALAANGTPSNGGWKLELKTLEEVICAPTGSTYSLNGLSPELAGFLKADSAGLKAELQDGESQPVGPVAALPLLNSKPDSIFVLYIDFDGEVVKHPGWNNGSTINALPDPGANDEAYVRAVWARVAEDYAAFDLNVTTDRAVFDTSAVSNRVMCISTPTDTAAPGAGGVAYLSSFGQDTPCWNFNVLNDYYSADTVSHEVGHSLGLDHDGKGNEEYYGGHGGAGPTSWSPIMGAAWANANEEAVTQFSKGEYPDATNQEDDFLVITSNGFGYEPDDKGNTLAAAAELKIVNGEINDSGIIERDSDLDWISFVTSGGEVSLDITVTNVQSPYASQRGANLALSVELYDSAGTLLQTSNDGAGLDASIAADLAPGIYYIRIDGAPRGDLSTGFPEYGSIGQYYITGSIPQSGLISVNPSFALYEPFTETGSCDISTGGDWTWSCDADWINSFENVSQSGNQRFDYSVSANPNNTSRTAEIVFSIPGYSVSHTVTQRPNQGDDHSNFIENATAVSSNSVTAGVLEEAGDLDVFRVLVSEFGQLTVETSGSTNTFGELLNSTGVVLASNDNLLLPNFRISQSVSPGIYYVRVRHALTLGTGAYFLTTRLNSQNAIALNPMERTVPAMGGDYGFSVISNAFWEWSTDVSWLSSDEPTSQIFGQRFNYTVAENTGSERVGRITLTAGIIEIEHVVTQPGAGSDDHGNTNSQATHFPLDASLAGEIEAEGDVDVFELILSTSGELELWSTGLTDTHATLYDAEGAAMGSNDDAVGLNFGISTFVPAGTYYLHLRHFSKLGIGSYTVHNTFEPASHVSVRYSAGYGGQLNGPPVQQVAVGGDAVVVTAVPSNGFVFVQWSDGHLLAAREDTNVLSPFEVEAEFAPTLAVGIDGGDSLRDNQSPKIDFGQRWINEFAPITFVVRNNGETPLSDLQLVKSGINADQWTLTALPTTTLLAGESVTFTATLQGTSPGEKTAFFTLRATGDNVLPFRIPVIATILNNVIVFGSNTGSADAMAADQPGLHATELQISELTASIAAIASDGLYHYAFALPVDQIRLPTFQYSLDGIEWAPAEPVLIQRLRSGDDLDEYEALFAPLAPNPFAIQISEVPIPNSAP
ncbi:MAG: BACON domain-containing protein [Luteolibacter sp.]